MDDVVMLLAEISLRQREPQTPRYRRGVRCRATRRRDEIEARVVVKHDR
jgi:hypothetical protein